MSKKPFLYLFIFFAIVSCNENKKPTEEELAKHSYQKEVVKVKIAKVEYGIFNNELVSNGKLSALRKAEIQFKVSENILTIPVKNGDKVAQGQLLAVQEPFTTKLRCERAKNAMEKANSDLEDLLIGFGYKIKDTAQVPASVLNNAKIRCSYNQTMLELKEAEYNYQATRILAPFAGIVANLTAKPNNPSSNYKTFCTLIDYSTLEADFQVLESEASKIALNQRVEISPFANQQKKYFGIITNINPVVDEKGMITVKAEINNSDGSLLDGMNVKVLIRSEIPGQLIIPKESLVIRQGKQVVFGLQNDTLAYWHYVDTEYENSTQFTIKPKDLKQGDIIIVTGNFNLAHESRVTVIKE